MSAPNDPEDWPLHPNVVALAQLLDGQVRDGHLEIHVVHHPGENRGWDVVIRFDGGYSKKDDATTQAEYLAMRITDAVGPGVRWGRRTSEPDTIRVLEVPD